MDTLKKSGIPENQARAISKAFAHAHTELNFATKADIQYLEHRLVDLENRLIIKMGAMMTLASGLIVTLVKVL